MEMLLHDVAFDRQHAIVRESIVGPEGNASGLQLAILFGGEPAVVISFLSSGAAEVADGREVNEN